ncbi:replication protein A 70 kDa DNA-binding subunit B-like [Setaria viridis]|uniref:replication protein A 70 kDa DNA-binding subunit B-like n=1 Tax=Setaria viridis TaxID=4556 RepID=UPI000646D83B
MEYSLLSQINPARHNWCVKVRVARMWQVSRTSKGRDFASMELVVVDEEGQGIMASIIDKALKKFSKSIVEGHCYCVRNFQVSKQERKFKAIPSTYTIFLTPWTIIEEIHAEVSASLPRYVFSFVDFDDLDHSRARHGQGLVDIIGQLAVVHLVVHSSSLNGPSVRWEVELPDLSDRVLSVTLWGEYATPFEDEVLIETTGNDEPVVIIFARMQVRLYQGAPNCLSNAATKWYINIDIPEVNAFRASLQGRGSEVLLPGDVDATVGDVDEENANRKTVSELLFLNPHDSNDVLFTCHTTIKEIDVTNGWWYKGCSICKKGLKQTLQGFACTNCNETEPVVVPSYKLNVVIEDATSRAKIFMFGGVAEQVERRTAAKLVEESSSNQILLLGALRALVGRSYVFQVISEQTYRTEQLCLEGWC